MGRPFFCVQNLPNGNPMTEKLLEKLKHDTFASLTEAKVLEPTTDGRKRWEVIILTEGKGNPKDKHLYSQKCIESPATAHAFDGAKCFIDHPDAIEESARPERTIRAEAGWFSKPFAEGNALKAILTQGTTEGGKFLEAYIADCFAYAKDHPGQNYGGISINASGEIKRVKIDGVEWKQVDEITEAFSADAVTLPARGGMFLKQLEAYRKQRESMAGAEVKKILVSMREKVLAGLDGKEIKRMIDNAITACEGNVPESGRESMKTEDQKLQEAKRKAEAKQAYMALQKHHETEAEESEDEAEKKKHQAEAEKYKAMCGESDDNYDDDMKPAEKKKAAAEAKKKKEAEDEMEAKKKKEAEYQAESKKKESQQIESLRQELFDLKLDKKLQEAGLPEVFHKRVKLMSNGLTDQEVDEVIESVCKEHEFTLKESGVSTPTRRGLAGAEGSFKESNSILAKRGI